MFHWFERRVDPFPDAEPPVPPRALFAFAWGATKGMRGYMLGMGLLSAVTGLFEAFLFASLGVVVNWLAAATPALFWAENGHLVLILAGIVAVSVALVAVQSLLHFQTLSGLLPTRMSWDFHRLLLKQSMDFFQDEFAGRLTTKLMQTATALRDLYMVVVDVLTYAIIYFVTMFATAGYFDLWLLVPFAVWMVGYVALLRWVVPKLASASEGFADARSAMVGRITDAYANIATVKLFAHAGREANYAKNSMGEFLSANRHLFRYISQFEILNYVLGMSLVLGACGVAVHLWTQGMAGVGALAAVGAMALRLNGMSHWLMWESAQMFEHVGTAYDGLSTFSLVPKVADAPDASALVVTRGDIQFEDVSFCYGAGERVLEHFSLHIRPGEKIGLVGRSGVGKSTLVNLLLRFYDVEQGRILIDGQDISLATQESLRSQIGMVMQDTSLLHRSVRDNILYGRPDASEEALAAAAARASADGFIARLEDGQGRKGYDAHVGERGVKLSGGQRQRIAIARVMLKDAPILVLDEATSALDSEVEAAIQENLYRLMEGKTVVAIAHRLSTIAAMDRLVVMDGGRIAEQGSHKTLLEAGGVYAGLWARQSGGFLGAED